MKKTEATEAWGKLPENIRNAVINNSLITLKPDDRIALYEAMCEAKGLDKATRPFEFITLNGKLAMYARKECADQLRERNGVSVIIVSQAIQGAAYVVHVKATTPDDKREEDDIGATSIVEPEFLTRPGQGGKNEKYANPRYGKAMEGIDVANAIMKAVTKAKRRVTLSICGLGMFDESEIEAINEADKGKAPSMEEVKKIAAQVAELRARAAKFNAGSKESKDLIREACELEAAILDLPGSGHAEEKPNARETQKDPERAPGASPAPEKPKEAPSIPKETPKAPAPPVVMPDPENVPGGEPERGITIVSQENVTAEEIPLTGEPVNWREHLVTKIKHKSVENKKLGEVASATIKIIYENWVLKFTEEIAKNPEKTADAEAVKAAVKELGL